MRPLTRRGFLSCAAASTIAVSRAAPAPTPLFDGKTLDGWIQVENSATSLSAAAIADPQDFRRKLATAADPVSARLRNAMSEAARNALAAAPVGEPGAAVSEFVKELNRILAGPSLYDQETFGKVVLRPETMQLAKAQPTPWNVARLNRLLLEDAYPSDIAKSVIAGWTVKDGAMASTGSGRGVIYTSGDYSRFRLMFTLRHVQGNPDHQPGILIFCARPQTGEKPLDALGGIQFQAPNGGHWDYRPGRNNDGGSEFTRLTQTRFDSHQWSRVEIVADALRGIARMAVAQPPGSRAVEMLAFNDPTAGRPGPIAWQMHNAGLFDEFKDVVIEADPSDTELVTVRSGA